MNNCAKLTGIFVDYQTTQDYCDCCLAKLMKSYSEADFVKEQQRTLVKGMSDEMFDIIWECKKKYLE